MNCFQGGNICWLYPCWRMSNLLNGTSTGIYFYFFSGNYLWEFVEERLVTRKNEALHENIFRQAFAGISTHSTKLAFITEVLLNFCHAIYRFGSRMAQVSKAEICSSRVIRNIRQIFVMASQLD